MSGDTAQHGGRTPGPTAHASEEGLAVRGHLSRERLVSWSELSDLRADGGRWVTAVTAAAGRTGGAHGAGAGIRSRAGRAPWGRAASPWRP
ncbi:PH domain-containing protein [Serinicoccus chungangensis]|uniref:PH domain-containing protein n=1 Tax=Serinicoccus chungangensis TaxID=767452 RepID=UPI0009F9B3AB